MTNLPVDQFWPRAGHWLEAGSTAEKTDITVVGIGAHLTSLTPTGADKTPDAIRQALFKYSTYSWAHDIDIASLSVRDAGNITDPDWEEGEETRLGSVSSGTEVKCCARLHSVK